MPCGGGQFAPSNMAALKPVVHDMRANSEVCCHFGHCAFLGALERGDGNRMFEPNPPNRRDRQAIAFPCFHSSLIQVLDHLFISRVLGECTHLFHQGRIVSSLVGGVGPEWYAEFFGRSTVPAELERHGFCRFRNGDVFKHQAEHALTVFRRSCRRVPQAREILA